MMDGEKKIRAQAFAAGFEVGKPTVAFLKIL